MFFPMFAIGGGSGRRWTAINDKEMSLTEAIGDLKGQSYFLGVGDAVEMPDGTLWICTRTGTSETARVVQGRYKKPTEIFP